MQRAKLLIAWAVPAIGLMVLATGPMAAPVASAAPVP